MSCLCKPLFVVIQQTDFLFVYLFVSGMFLISPSDASPCSTVRSIH